MQIKNLTLSLSVAALAMGCVINSDDDGGADGSDDTGGTTNTTPGTTTNTTPGTTTNDTTAGTVDGSGTDSDGSSSGTTAVDPGPFVEDDPDPSLYTRVDRMGAPGVNTALIGCTDPDTDCRKNEYNAANPNNDVMNAFIGDLAGSAAFVYGALLDDIQGIAALTECANETTCFNQIQPVIVPDTLRIDLTANAGFPNGRALPDQVIDMVLAALLLDLTGIGMNPPAHSLTDLADIPLASDENDVPFGKEFPFLAPAH